MKLKINHILILVLLGIILYLKGCEDTDNIEPQVYTQIETKWDTFPKIDTQYVPKWRTKVEVKIDTFNTPIDTFAVLKDFYAKNYYQDTIKLDSLGIIVINDTITRNILASRKIIPTIAIPVTTISKEIYLNPREYYWGAGVTGNMDGLNYIGGEFLYRGKNRQALGIGIGINQELKPLVTFRYFQKIGK